MHIIECEAAKAAAESAAAKQERDQRVLTAIREKRKKAIMRAWRLLREEDRND